MALKSQIDFNPIAFIDFYDITKKNLFPLNDQSISHHYLLRRNHPSFCLTIFMGILEGLLSMRPVFLLVVFSMFLFFVEKASKNDFSPLQMALDHFAKRIFPFFFDFFR
jgi:hypothetical protein